MNFEHVSVMLMPTVDMLNVREGGIYVDGTLGGGGHSAEILRRLNGTGHLYGIDRDNDALAAATERLGAAGNFTAVKGNFHDVKALLAARGVTKIDGMMIDLGVSSYQLDTAERGFSYHADAPLDMRMDQDQALTAREIVNTWSAEDIARILREYSEEKWAVRIAQIICESGQGDTMSQLATRDHNLFGIKWASSFASCPEVAGKASWATREEAGGQVVTVMADFTVFKGDADCIRFRSRVLLQNSRYADNALIKEAIADRDSDKMAEGLKDAGYATSSEYVESLKSAMRAYNLYRFDGMGVDDFEKGAAGGDAIVQAAYSQLGVPYVWGGSTPGVGLDCSGLTQYCYRQAGISISHYTEDQLKELTVVPLSQARPGDILYKYGHVAIYVGGDEYIHEPRTGDVCRKATGISYFTCALRYTG